MTQETVWHKCSPLTRAAAAASVQLFTEAKKKLRSNLRMNLEATFLNFKRNQSGFTGGTAVGYIKLYKKRMRNISVLNHLSGN